MRTTRTLLLLLVSTVFVLPVQAQKKLTAAEAKDHVGETASVCGEVVLHSLVPQIHKEFRCCRTVPGKVIVAEGKNFQDFGVAHQRFEYLDPILQIASAVNDSFVPCLCYFFDSLAVT
jgi:hypothetical protein